MKKQFGFTSTEMIMAIGAWVMLAGWVWNIAKLASICCEISGSLVLRAVGVFVPPLGAVIGFL